LEYAVSHIHDSCSSNSDTRNSADADNYTCLEEQLASDDVLEISPTFVKSSGIFLDRRHEYPRGSVRKPKFLKEKDKDSRYSSSDEGNSDEDRVADDTCM
jgi:hypothetical protein